MTLTSIHNSTQPVGAYLTNVSDYDIVPDDIQNELMSWRDVFTLGYFSIGDIARELVERSLALGMPVSNIDVYRAVGRFCGKSARTVRYYAEMANFFPKEIRDEYDMLPFTHFRLARTFGNDYREVLEFAKANPHYSEEGLRMAISSGDVLTREIDLPIMDDLNESFSAPEPSGERTGHFISVFSSKYRLANAIGDLVEHLRGITESVPLQPDTASRLVRALDEIKKCLPEILEAIDRGE